MPPVLRIVVDVLKPHDPDLVTFTRRVGEAESVASVNVARIETDREVENVGLAVEGEALDIDALEAHIEDLGGVVHSVDEVACGESLIEPHASRDGVGSR